MIFDPVSGLPYIIRSREDHKLFGPSNKDLYLLNYTSVNGVIFPHRFTTLYNGETIEDFDISSITVNPKFSKDFFSDLPTNATVPAPGHATANATYEHAELGEWYQNMLWRGPYIASLNNITAVHPIKTLPNLWYISFGAASGYRQTVMAFKDAVIVTDAPPHQTDLINQWVKENIGRPITHVWVSPLDV